MEQKVSTLMFKDAPIRVQMVKGEPWFVAKDVCEVLGLVKTDSAMRRLRDDEADTLTMSIRSENGVEQNREVTIVNESGLYALIFQSRKEKAQEFRYWVTSEVLPAIRKYGRYEVAGSKARLQLEARLEKKQRKDWLRALNDRLTSADERAIARKCSCTDYYVWQVLAGVHEDATVEMECVVRAVRNARIREILSDETIREEIMRMMGRRLM